MAAIIASSILIPSTAHAAPGTAAAKTAIDSNRLLIETIDKVESILRNAATALEEAVAAQRKFEHRPLATDAEADRKIVNVNEGSTADFSPKKKSIQNGEHVGEAKERVMKIFKKKQRSKSNKPPVVVQLK